jgi:hypothetical protein
MSKMNVLLSLNLYQDSNATNTPSKSHSKWSNDLQGIEISKPVSASTSLAPGASLTLFSGEVTVSDDNTTKYDLALKAGTSNTYVLTYNTGTAPAFRTARNPGAGATTVVTVTKNATLLTFTSTVDAFDLITNSVAVGDEVRLGSLFNTLNQGKYTILARTATTFTIENASGVGEAVTLGAGFAAQVLMYSAAGVQVGDNVKIDAGFSSVSFGTYDITDVTATYLEFYSGKTLPTETAIYENLQVFNTSKKFIYIESSQSIALTIDGSSHGTIDPIQYGTSTKPGMFLKNSDMYSASITNNTLETAEVYYCCAE